MPLLSLRVVISVTSALLVTLVAAAALAILLTTSTASLRDVGRSHAAGLIETVQHRTVALFEPSFITLDMMANFTRSRYWAWPSEDPALLDMFLERAEAAYQARELRSPGVLAYFWDNTRVSIDQYNSTHYQRYIVGATSVSAPGGLAGQTITSNGSLVNFADDFTLTAARYNPNSTGNRVRGTSMEALLLTITVSGRQASIAGIFDRAIDNETVESYVTLATPLFRKGDAPTTANLYGVALTSLFIEDMNAFLADSRATPNTAAFAADGFGYLYGSSVLDRPIRTITPVAKGDTTTVQGCSTTDSVGGISTGPNKLVCRASYRTYGHAALADVPSTVFRRPGSSVELTELAGALYFLATVRVPMRLPGMPIQLVLLMPETDVIGDVVQSRNIAIGIVAALVLVAGAVNFGVVFVLLSPLEAIALRMRKAANLEDDGADEEVSAMSEVAELQQAYYAMNDELNRIRSFVPQSVLMAKQMAMDASASDEDLDTDLGASRSRSSIHGGHPHSSSDLPTSSGVVGHGAASIDDTGSRRSSRTGASARRQHDDAISRGSRHSSRSAADAVAAAALRGAAVLDALSLKPRVVTVVVANLCGFLPELNNAMAKAHAIAHVTDMVDFVFRTVTRHGGVLASYHGDHFVATFNAVKACGSHALSGARAACVLTDESDGVGFGSALRVGVATGRCQVGNLGNKEIKAFSTVGPAYQHACVLERMGRLYGEADERSVLATRRTCSDIATQFRFRYVDIVALPGRERVGGATITPIATLLQPPVLPAGAAGAAAPGENDDEWLYVVGGRASDDPNGAWNEAFNKLMLGDVAAAKALVADYAAIASQALGSVANSTSGTPGSQPGSDLTDPRAAAVMIGSANTDDHVSRIPRAQVATRVEQDRFAGLCAKGAADRFQDMGIYYNAAFGV